MGEKEIELKLKHAKKKYKVKVREILIKPMKGVETVNHSPFIMLACYWVLMDF